MPYPYTAGDPFPEGAGERYYGVPDTEFSRPLAIAEYSWGGSPLVITATTYQVITESSIYMSNLPAKGGVRILTASFTGMMSGASTARRVVEMNIQKNVGDPAGSGSNVYIKAVPIYAYEREHGRGTLLIESFTYIEPDVEDDVRYRLAIRVNNNSSFSFDLYSVSFEGSVVN